MMLQHSREVQVATPPCITQDGKLDWHILYAGKITREEINMYTPLPAWQSLRLHLKGKNLTYKFCSLWSWLEEHAHSRSAQVQVANYVTALSRGGLIKREDYL